MPALNPQGRERLVDRLRTALRKTVAADGACDAKTMWLELKQLDASVHRAVAKECAEFGLDGFSRFAIHEIHYASSGYDEGVFRFAAEADLDELAVGIVGTFVTLPWKYSAVVPLPLESPLLSERFGGRYAISESLTIHANDDHGRAVLHDVFRSAEDYNAATDSALGIEAGILMVLSLDGYHLTRIPDPLIRSRSTLRQFIGLAIASSLVRVGTLDWSHPHRFATFPRLCDPLVLPTGGERRTESLHPENAAVVRALEWAPSAAEKAGAALHQIGAAFRTNNERLLRAGEWLFRSYAGSEELQQIVEATTAIEILLVEGPEESRRVGLTELLANRCAYLLGSSANERRAIMSEFEEVYDTRSRIVHAGKTSGGHEKQLERARELCCRILEKELRFADEG